MHVTPFHRAPPGAHGTQNQPKEEAERSKRKRRAGRERTNVGGTKLVKQQGGKGNRGGGHTLGGGTLKSLGPSREGRKEGREKHATKHGRSKPTTKVQNTEDKGPRGQGDTRDRGTEATGTKGHTGPRGKRDTKRRRRDKREKRAN